jgi:type VI secretion system protein ImpJ
VSARTFGCPPAGARAAAGSASPASADGCRPAPAAGQTTRFGSVPDPVAWHEGMLLAPQHFQQAALHAEAVLGYHLAALSPYHWGVRRLALDCAKLREGILRVAELDAVMPDGLPVRRRDGDPELQVQLDPSAAAAGGVLTVHLAVRPRSARPDAAGSLARQECYPGEPAPDLLSGEGALEVLRMRPRLSLVVSAERPRGWVSFPLARVRAAGGGWALTDGVPPLLALGTSAALRDRCAELLCAVRGRAAALGRTLRADRLAGRWTHAATVQPALAGLSAVLPRLEALVHAAAAHPHAVYLGLCDLAGQLAAVGPGRVPPLFRGYDHDDPAGSLRPLLRFCEDALEEVQTGWVLLAFARRGARFGIRPEAWTVSGAASAQTLLVCAVAPAGTDRKALTGWMARARIAPASRMAALLRAEHSAGLPRDVADAPDGLSAAENRLYLRIPVPPCAPGERLLVVPPASCTDAGRPRAIVLCRPVDEAPAAMPFIPIPWPTPQTPQMSPTPQTQPPAQMQPTPQVPQPPQQQTPPASTPPPQQQTPPASTPPPAPSPQPQPSPTPQAPQMQPTDPTEAIRQMGETIRHSTEIGNWSW